MAAEKPCTLILSLPANDTPPNVSELAKQLEKGTPDQKIEAMKTVITHLLNGETYPQLLMVIIRFVMPINNKKLKKLLLLYWEIVDKSNAQGKLLQEFILVCNALRNDLTHSNEYVRGATLRFITKLKEADILEPLLPSIRQNLQDKHAYVRRLAVLALYNIHKNFEHLCPDAPELVYNFLLNEGDASCKRNAFIMLFNCAQEKAIQYMSSILDQVVGMGEIIQIIVVELIRKVCRTNPQDRSKYIKCIFTLLTSTSPSVQYEAAGTLVSLSAAPTAVRAAASTFIDLLVKESDNNVKLIVLDRLSSIKQNHPKILESLIMDVLRALSSPSMDIRQKTLDLVLDLISSKNVEEVVGLLKKEILKTQSKEFDKGEEYRQVLIQTIHTCAIKFPEVVSNVVQVLMDFLGDPVGGSAVDVILFVREVVETYPDLRESIVSKLLENFRDIKSPKVYRIAFWIIGEYANTTQEIDNAFTILREVVGELPFVRDEEVEQTESKEESKEKKAASTSQPKTQVKSGPKLNIDGTYATQSAMVEKSDTAPTTQNSTQPTLRSLIMNGDFFLASAMITSLTKLALKTSGQKLDPTTQNMIAARVMMLGTCLLRLGESPKIQNPIDPDSYDRIISCIRVLSNPTPFTKNLFLKETKVAFSNLIKAQQATQKSAEKSKKKVVQVQADDLIKVSQLRKKNAGLSDQNDIDDTDVIKATGIVEQDQSLQLNRICQLTGFSDPIYAEAYVNVHQYDIVLDVIVVNQTAETLQNVALELATLGDLKLVERPQTYTIGPHSKTNIKVNIKVSSTETGIIFGNIVYDVAGTSSSDKNCVVLNDIHIDIMDYINPATCSELKFHRMWAEFEWENKVAVSTNITDVNEFLQHIIRSTNMNCLTSPSALEGTCDFLSANLYAKSVFGEDALANVSIELSNGKITGWIRIRSKTQGIALSLGDKITNKMNYNPSKGGFN